MDNINNISENLNPKPRRVLHRDRGSKFSVIKAIQTVSSVAIITATLFTLWTPANLFSGEVLDSMLVSINETAEPEAAAAEENPEFAATQRIGIVAGHWQDGDGHVCKDGLKEVWLNIRIATLVQQNLADSGFQIDLLKEKDSLLTQYKGIALISIHNDTCDFIDGNASGFKIAPAMRSSYPDEMDKLLECMAENFAAVTGLTYHPNETTYDMTEYHNFYEVNSSTPVIVIETGYMNLDRQILTENSELIAQGITSGIQCFIQTR